MPQTQAGGRVTSVSPGLFRSNGGFLAKGEGLETFPRESVSNHWKTARRPEKKPKTIKAGSRKPAGKGYPVGAPGASLVGTQVLFTHP